MPYTARAAPMIPLTLRSIHTATGLYVVGLKANQANLYRQCICQSLFHTADYEQLDGEKSSIDAQSNVPTSAIPWGQ